LIITARGSARGRAYPPRNEATLFLLSFPADVHTNKIANAAWRGIQLRPLVIATARKSEEQQLPEE